MSGLALPYRAHLLNLPAYDAVLCIENVNLCCHLLLEQLFTLDYFDNNRVCFRVMKANPIDVVLVD